MPLVYDQCLLKAAHLQLQCLRQRPLYPLPLLSYQLKGLTAGGVGKVQKGAGTTAAAGETDWPAGRPGAVARTFFCSSVSAFHALVMDSLDTFSSPASLRILDWNSRYALGGRLGCKQGTVCVAMRSVSVRAKSQLERRTNVRDKSQLVVCSAHLSLDLFHALALLLLALRGLPSCIVHAQNGVGARKWRLVAASTYLQRLGRLPPDVRERAAPTGAARPRTTCPHINMHWLHSALQPGLRCKYSGHAHLSSISCCCSLT